MSKSEGVKQGRQAIDLFVIVRRKPGRYAAIVNIVKKTVTPIPTPLTTCRNINAAVQISWEKKVIITGSTPDVVFSLSLDDYKTKTIYSKVKRSHT